MCARGHPGVSLHTCITVLVTLKLTGELCRQPRSNTPKTPSDLNKWVTPAPTAGIIPCFSTAAFNSSTVKGMQMKKNGIQIAAKRCIHCINMNVRRWKKKKKKKKTYKTQYRKSIEVHVNRTRLTTVVCVRNERNEIQMKNNKQEIDGKILSLSKSVVPRLFCVAPTFCIHDCCRQNSK